MTPSLYPSLRLLLSTPDALIPDAAARLGNPSWESAPRRILIVRLSPFKDVARSSTHLLLFSECRSSLPEAFLDFAFFPDRGDRELLEERGLSWYYGLASGHPASDFDLVMVSLSFSLELVNLPYLFSTSGLALLAGERAAAREAGCASPLVVLGGSSAATAASLASPEGDSLVDAFFFGEGEGAIGELATILSERREAPRSRLERAGLVEGFRLPRAGGRFEAMRRIARPAPLPLVEYPILNSEESSTARLQISAGCPGLCSFCLEGWDRRPYRELSLDAILAAARELRYRSGADTLEVYSFNFNTHAEIFDLLFELNRIFLRVNFMSQRVDAIASTRGLLRAELAADKRSFTLGIEGISRRMRAYYRKGLSDEGIASAIDELLRAKGVRELKLFYIVSGLENEADLAEFASFASSLGRRKGAEAPGLRILASAGYLVRLPGTPLQYAPLALDEAPLSRIASALGSICASSGIELRLATHFDEYCVDQVLSLAGGRLLPWYGSVTRKGLCYDGSLSLGTWPSLESFARGALIIDEAFLGEKASSWPPPLSFCDDAVLRSHYEEARRFEDRSPCLGAGCAGCGACDEDSDRAAIGGHEARAMAGEAYIERLSRLMAAKAAFPSVLVAVDLPASLAGASPEYRSSWLQRALFARSPKAAEAIFAAKEALFSSGPLESMLPPSFTGKCVFALAGPQASRISRCAEAGGFVVLGALPLVSRVELEVEIQPPWAVGAMEALYAWLAEERINCVETHSGDERVLTPSPRDARKSLLISARIAEAEIFRARLVLGPKARLPDWLSRLGPRAPRAARVEVLGYSAC